MEKRIALIGIIVEDPESVASVNAILHDFARFIVGRMGIPRPEHGVCVISVVVEAPSDEINALSGKLGRIGGVRAKCIQTGKVVGPAV